MKSARSFALGLLLSAAFQLGCAFLIPTQATPQVAASPSAVPTASPSAAPSPQPSLEPSAEPSAAPSAAPSAEPGPASASATAAPTALPVASPSPTTAPRRVEVVQSQAWTDYLGHVRVNFLVRNPYDFPVAPAFGLRASLWNSAGEFIRDRQVYFLDGISGGGGFLLPGETIAGNACFTCETTPLPEAWASVELTSNVEDATGLWDYSTAVEASVADVSFEGDSPIFWIAGTAKNNSDSALQRISVRVFVFDPEGKLVGAAEASAWEVGPGAVASVSGYGFGQTPAGPVTYEVTALGVNY